MIAQENQRTSECNPENRGGAGFLEFFCMTHFKYHIHPYPACLMIKVIPSFDGGYQAEKATWP